MPGCYCLCAMNHPTVLGCCSGEAVTTLRFNNELGPRDIPMCKNCAAGTESTARAGRALLRSDQIREPSR